jgi:RecA/RadA recombinase
MDVKMDYTEETISVGKLREMWFSDEYEVEIDSPDGWQPVVDWWDKGSLPMVRVSTADGFETECATNHLIQKLDDNNPIWVMASELASGDLIITTTGHSVVSIVESIDDAECFDFEVAHVNHRYYGDGISSHNSGKSYICTANLIKDCLKKGVAPILIDTENALDESWLRKFDINTDLVEKYSGAKVDDVAKLIGEFIDLYREQTAGVPYEERPKVLLIIDSLGMLITPNQEKQFNEGDMKGDMGIKAKQVTAMLRVAMAKIACEPIGLVATNHVYDSQDQYKPDTIPGGKMLEFASSIIIQMNKLLLREDVDGKKLTDGEVAGMKASIVVRKSRYAKPFERLKINVPYDTGMDPYSGLFELFEKKGVIVPDGKRYTWTSRITGEVQSDYRKRYKANGWLDNIMSEWEKWENSSETVGFDDTGITADDLDEED